MVKSTCVDGSVIARPERRLPCGRAQLRATSRITLSPIVETLPCVGGVSVTLLEAPYFDANFSLISTYDILALPFIHDGVQFAAKVRTETMKTAQAQPVA